MVNISVWILNRPVWWWSNRIVSYFTVLSYRRMPSFLLKGFQIDWVTVVIYCAWNNSVDSMSACKAQWSRLLAPQQKEWILALNWGWLYLSYFSPFLNSFHCCLRGHPLFCFIVLLYSMTTSFLNHVVKTGMMSLLLKLFFS